MKSRTRLFATLAIALLCAGAASSSQASSIVTIDFESLAEGDLVTSQFAVDRIVFGNLHVRTAGSTLNEFDFPPTSGVNVATGVGAGPAVVEFLSPARLFSVQLTTFGTAVVEAYGAGNVLLDSRTVLDNLGSSTLVTFMRSDRDMTAIRIAGLSGDAFLLTIDDVVFAIPEPSAFLVMAVGILPITAAIRRHKRA
jgi:hypothetical protein